MLTALALLVALACVAASARRLRFAIAPTVLDPATLAASLRGDAGSAGLAVVCAAVAEVPEAEWERALIDAVQQPAETRAPLVNEQLTELDYRVHRWSRVPRVCASITTSTGLLLATMALRAGLSVATDLPDELRDAAVGDAVTDAINVAAIGLAGAAFCIAIQMRARQAAKARAEAADRLVERLEALASREA